MAIKKSVVDEFVVPGLVGYWLGASAHALQTAGFTGLWSPNPQSEVAARYRKATVYGELRVGVYAASPQDSRIVMTAKANVDNVYALFRSPGRRIIEAFRTSLLGRAG
ncbi:hypothetical protein GCM10018793_35370 [Streptomyces sulfonofaciens]|uniref:Uncharacterized protein n=1 Tax=Streptomyces sulfonofaciens TaxID=68272 RepID=A0A919L1X4_9ACTN|nr:hypothetical protein [Streptomyces sulfonofaciens]GHH80364.1 hypothetical protein GCM10018793_35370 [Streptomyces sulfonofaciens]